MIEVAEADPLAPEALALLRQSHDLMNSLYPAEARHYFSVDRLTEPDITFVLAWRRDRAIGCGALRRTGATEGEIKSMFVAPDARGTGAGRTVLDHLVALARHDGLTTLKLETGTGLEAAHGLYQSAGFTACGPFGDYSPGPFSLFMELKL